MPAGVTDGYVITADSGEPSGVVWAAPAGGGGVEVKDAGTPVGTRTAINLIEGSNVTLTIADDAGNDEVDVTIAASGGGTIEWEDVGTTGPGGGGGFPFSGASVTRTADQSFSGDVSVAFTAEAFDTDTYHDNSTDNTRLTIPVTGYYLVGYSISLLTTGELAVYVRKNGNTALRYAVSYNASSALGICGSEVVSLVATDYVECRVYSGAGGSVDGTSAHTPRFWITRVG